MMLVDSSVLPLCCLCVVSVLPLCCLCVVSVLSAALSVIPTIYRTASPLSLFPSTSDVLFLSYSCPVPVLLLSSCYLTASFLLLSAIQPALGQADGGKMTL